jgi:hypothetical protein
VLCNFSFEQVPRDSKGSIVPMGLITSKLQITNYKLQITNALAQIRSEINHAYRLCSITFFVTNNIVLGFVGYKYCHQQTYYHFTNYTEWKTANVSEWKQSN